MVEFSYARNQFNRDARRHFSINTLQTYNIALKQFNNKCNKSLDEICFEQVEDWIDYLTINKLKPQTIMVKLSALKVFFNYCFEEGYISKDPTLGVESPKIPDSLPRYFDKVTMFKFREEAKNNPRDRAILELLYCSGLRASELINLLLEDICWQTRQIDVRNGKGAKDGYIMFTVSCSEYLKRYISTRNDKSPYLFVTHLNKPFTRQGLWKLIKKYVNWAQVDSAITIHSFRHSFATNLAEKGAPFEIIQEFLRVDDPKTATIYARLTNHARKVKYDKYRN